MKPLGKVTRPVNVLAPPTVKVPEVAMFPFPPLEASTKKTPFRKVVVLAPMAKEPFVRMVVETVLPVVPRAR